MCLFPTLNKRKYSVSYLKGITEFECGYCPECLKRRASRHMVRDVFESKAHSANCMCTLTYDSYLRDSLGRVVGERTPDRSLHVCKRDVQLFIKRLRRYIEYNYPLNGLIKYRVTAEYGKKTHRAHYHILIFGWTFPDCVFYKKSKRGSLIYKSAILTKLWHHGICTVDSKCVTPAVARYCSKYTAKDYGKEDTFSLCSHSLGLSELYKAFNGRSYYVDGVEYPIPRQVWERYITDCYSGRYHFSTKYVPVGNKYYSRYRRLRRAYQIIRDHDPSYRLYLDYWRSVSLERKRIEKPVLQRIRELPDKKYFSYKLQALECYRWRSAGQPCRAPRKPVYTTEQAELDLQAKHKRYPLICRNNSCLYTANDTKSITGKPDSQHRWQEKADFVRFILKSKPKLIDWNVLSKV